MDYTSEPYFLQPDFPVFAPGIFDTVQDEDEYMASLDSDTREYVKNHVDEFSTKADMVRCVEGLNDSRHGEIL